MIGDHNYVARAEVRPKVYVPIVSEDLAKKVMEEFERDERNPLWVAEHLTRILRTKNWRMANCITGMGRASYCPDLIMYAALQAYCMVEGTGQLPILTGTAVIDAMAEADKAHLPIYLDHIANRIEAYNEYLIRSIRDFAARYPSTNEPWAAGILTLRVTERQLELNLEKS